MAYEQRDDTGSLFKNDKKEAENHPDYNGSAMVGGVEYWMKSWIKTSQKGTKWMSFSFTPKEEQKKEPPKQSSDSRHLESHEDPGADLDDEIPF